MDLKGHVVKKFMVSMTIAVAALFGMSATALASGDIEVNPPTTTTTTVVGTTTTVAGTTTTSVSSRPPGRLPDSGGSFDSPLLIGFTALILGGGLVTIARQRRRSEES